MSSRATSGAARLVVALAFAGGAAADVWPLLCPVGAAYSGWNETRCPATQSCAKNGFSAGGGWGCCPWTNGVSCPSGFACCPQGSTCSLISGSGYSSIYQCSGASLPTISKCPCKPGQPLPPSTTLKNVLIIGDSLTIGYTPFVAANLADIALVQHAPWDTSDGGAEESSYFVQCLDNWMRSPSGEAWFPDLVYFNSGMHNLVVNGTGVPGQSGNASEYPAEMLNVMTRMKAFAASSPGGNTTKLIYGLTTPLLCDAGVDGLITGTLNAAAAAIASQLNIEIVDPHGPVIAKCGPAPQAKCFGLAGCFCPHCAGTPAYGWLADNVIGPAIRLMLTS